MANARGGAVVSEQVATYQAGPEPERYALCDGTMVVVVGSRWYIQRHDGNYVLLEEVVEELAAVWLERDENGRTSAG